MRRTPWFVAWITCLGVWATGCATGAGTPVSASSVSVGVSASPVGDSPSTDASASPSATVTVTANATATSGPQPLACTSVSTAGTFVSPGDAALTLTRPGDVVVVALKGDVYVEVGPGDLKVERELSLARLLIANVH